MVYRNNLSRDPRFRRIRFFSVVGGIAVLLAVLFVFQRGAGGFALPVLVLSAFIGYKITRYLQGHKNSYLETFDDHVTLRTPSGDVVTFEWDSLSRYGTAGFSDGDNFIYVYSDSLDRFFAIPESFENCDDLIDEFSERCERQDLTLDKDESMTDAIRRSVSVFEQADEQSTGTPSA